jgi:hypothetical protein
VSKIFLVLASLAVLLLALTIGMGLRIGQYNELSAELRSLEARRHDLAADEASNSQSLADRSAQLYAELEIPRRRAAQHLLMGIFAGLVTVLVNSISVTYFIGTSRWCKEVVETYELNPELVTASRQLKRRSFPWALAGVLLVLSILALGAAADPGTLRRTTQRWVLPHFAVALGGSALIALSFLVQADLIRRNSQLVERILAEVRDVRRRRGLDVES